MQNVELNYSVNTSDIQLDLQNLGLKPLKTGPIPWGKLSDKLLTRLLKEIELL